MTYLRSLFINFIVVLFVNRVIPGVQISTFQDVPNFGADLLFAAIVGFLNSSIFPALFILDLKPSMLKVAIVSFVISFGSYLVLAMMSFGVEIISAGGVIFGGLIVWIGSMVTNYFEYRHTLNP